MSFYFLFLSDGQYKKTVFNHKSSNVPSFHTAPGNTTYCSYTSQVYTAHSSTFDLYEQAICYPASTVISNDEESLVSTTVDDIDTIQPLPSPPQTVAPNFAPINTGHIDEDIADFSTPAPVTPPAIIEEEDSHIAATSDRGELLRWHYQLGHIPFSKLKLMALLNMIACCLALTKLPKCACCLYGKMTRKPWRTKAKNNRPIQAATKPVQCVSVDQMESSSMGFVGQLNGKLTTRRYKYCTVFIDNFPRYKYIYLQSSLSSQESLDAKIAFKAHSRALGVMILNYHADNGRFVDNAWIQDVQKKQ
jgi:hypothetical protein